MLGRVKKDVEEEDSDKFIKESTMDAIKELIQNTGGMVQNEEQPKELGK